MTCLFIANSNGRPIYNWQYIDELYDRMLAIGIRPFVELTFFPKDIAHDEGTFGWWRGSWHSTQRLSPMDGNHRQLCEALPIPLWPERSAEMVFRSLERTESRRLSGMERKQQFFEMYKAVATTIKSIDPELRVGGPSTSSFHPDEATYQRLAKKKDISAKDYIGVVSKGPWIEDFLEFLRKRKPSFGFRCLLILIPPSYPIDSAGNHLELSRPVSSTKEDILWLRKAMARTRYANAEIHLTEWSSSPSISDYAHDFPQEATYIVKVNLDCIGLAQSLSYWTFTTFRGGGEEPQRFSVAALVS